MKGRVRSVFRTAAVAVVLALRGVLAAAAADSDPAALWECTRAWQAYDVPAARTRLQAYLKRFPGDPDANDALASILRFYYLDFPAAEPYGQVAVTGKPEDPAKRLTLARIKAQQGRYSEAFSILFRGLSLAPPPKEADYFWEMARAASEASYPSQRGIPWLERAVALDPDHTLAWPWLHLLYVQTGQYGPALALWQNAHAHALSLGFGECVAARAAYAEALAAHERGAAWHLGLAALYDRLHLFREALAEYSLAHGTLPREHEARRDAIASFLRFRSRLNDLLDQFSRDQLFRPGAAQPAVTALLLRQRKDDAAMFWGLEGVKAASEEDALSLAFSKFGMVVRFSRRDDRRLDVNYGFVAGTRTETVDLWGERSQLQCVLLERMDQNGFDWWYMAGKGGTAGWCDEAARFSLIAETLGGHAALARSLSDPGTLARWMEANSHDALAGRGVMDVSSSPRLIRELTLRGFGMASGDPPSELDTRASEANLVVLVYRSGVVHEAQHALDERLVDRHQDGAEQEYRAKLAQLAYVERPHLQLAEAIALLADTQPGEPHAEGNSAILRDFCRIIVEQPARFPRIDAKRNILSQFALLDEEQIHALAREAFALRFPAGAYR